MRAHIGGVSGVGKSVAVWAGLADAGRDDAQGIHVDLLRALAGLSMQVTVVITGGSGSTRNVDLSEMRRQPDSLAGLPPGVSTCGPVNTTRVSVVVPPISARQDHWAGGQHCCADTRVGDYRPPLRSLDGVRRWHVVPTSPAPGIPVRRRTIVKHK